MAWYDYEDGLGNPISVWWTRLVDFLFRSDKCPYCKKWVRKVLYTCPRCRADLSQHWTAYKQMNDRMRENRMY